MTAELSASSGGERVALREARARRQMAEVLDRVSQGVVSVHSDLTVEFANRAAARLLGLRETDERPALPHSWQAIGLRDFATALFEQLEPTTEIRPASNGRATYSVAGVPAGDGDTVVLILTDSSGADRKEEAQRQFVTNAAHELQTPLAAIASAIEVLQAGARDVPEQRDRFLAHIERETARLSRLTRGLLTLARAQTLEEHPRKEPVDVQELLQRLSETLATPAGLVVRTDCHHSLLADANRDLLEQALSELATNAVKHTTAGEIVLSGRRAGRAKVAISISDTGSGVSSAEAEELFERFYRGQERRGEGFGLGLAIVRQVVSTLDGTIDLEPSPSGGLTARIVLPAVSEGVAG